MNEIIYVGRHAMMHTVKRHAHDSWDCYCTCAGGHAPRLDGHPAYPEGDVGDPAAGPPCDRQRQRLPNIHINMPCPSLAAHPGVIQDDGNHFPAGRRPGVAVPFQSIRPERTASPGRLRHPDLLLSGGLSEEPTAPPWWRRSSGHILAHCADSAFELDAFLRTLPFSYDYLRKLFQSEVGLTPHQYLKDKRLQIAAELLSRWTPTGSMAEIARMCGFREPLYFSRMFKKKYGVAPSFYVHRPSAAYFASRLTSV